jgi:hypothetical protein
MDGPVLFVSSCSRRELARRKAAGKFWTFQNFVWMAQRLSGKGVRKSRLGSTSRFGGGHWQR